MPISRDESLVRLIAEESHVSPDDVMKLVTSLVTFGERTLLAEMAGVCHRRKRRWTCEEIRQACQPKAVAA